MHPVYFKICFRCSGTYIESDPCKNFQHTFGTFPIQYNTVSGKTNIKVGLLGIIKGILNMRIECVFSFTNKCNRPYSYLFSVLETPLYYIQRHIKPLPLPHSSLKHTIAVSTNHITACGNSHIYMKRNYPFVLKPIIYPIKVPPKLMTIHSVLVSHLSSRH